ncbi:MAG: hypothetical protein HQK83_07185 [Fibrobacteria bacterium]|nr:hypothetical protein [Fibrobacteria bacterium]
MQTGVLNLQRKTFQLAILILLGVWSISSAQLAASIRNWDGIDYSTLPPLLSGSGFDPANTTEFVPYEVNVPQFRNLMYAKRYISVPTGQKIIPGDTSNYIFPIGTVLLRQIFLDAIYLEPTSQVNIEVQVQVRTATETWARFTYAFTNSQDDAILIDMSGYVDTTFFENIAGKGLKYETAPGVPATELEIMHLRLYDDCNQCHFNSSTNGFITQQLNKGNQLQTLVDKQVLASLPDLAGVAAKGMVTEWVDPYDTSKDLSQRALSYLAGNCSHCHAGTEERFESGMLSIFTYFQVPTGAVPFFMLQKDTNGAALNFIVGDPVNSVALTRMIDASMPGGTEVKFGDTRGIEVLWDWINAMDGNPANDALYLGVNVDVDDFHNTVSSHNKLSAFYQRGNILINRYSQKATNVKLFSIQGKNIELKKLSDNIYQISETPSPGVYLFTVNEDVILLPIR